MKFCSCCIQRRALILPAIALILAAPVCPGATATSQRNSRTGKTFNVRDFGAVGNGKALDTPAINRAIESAAKAGGGVVQIPPGQYLSTSIHLKSHVTIALEKGASLIAAGKSKQWSYDPPEPNPFARYQDFGHSHWHNSLIWGEQVRDVAIIGQGTIRGDGLVRGHTRPDDPADKAIALKRCTGVRISGITILHGGHVGILATGTDDLTIDGITIDTNRDGIDIDCCRGVRLRDSRINAPRDDGVCFKSSYALGEVRACENITVTGCLMSGYDEGTLADGSYRAATRTSQPSGHRVVRNGRLKFGTESNGGLKHMTVTDCRFENCAGMAFETVDGGDIEDLKIDHITMRDISTAPLFLRLGARLRGPGPRSTLLTADENLSPAAAAERAYEKASREASARAAARDHAATMPSTIPATAPVFDPYEHAGVLRDVVVSHLTVENAEAREPIVISGIPGHLIQNVIMKHLRIAFRGGGTSRDAAAHPPEMETVYPEPGMFGPLPAYGIFARHVSKLKCEDVTMTCQFPDARAAIVLDDAPEAAFTNIRADHPASVPAMIDNGIPRGSF